MAAERRLLAPPGQRLTLQHLRPHGAPKTFCTREAQDCLFRPRWLERAKDGSQNMLTGRMSDVKARHGETPVVPQAGCRRRRGCSEGFKRGERRDATENEERTKLMV